jgi:hypothetical protein
LRSVGVGLDVIAALQRAAGDAARKVELQRLLIARRRDLHREDREG